MCSISWRNSATRGPAMPAPYAVDRGAQIAGIDGTLESSVLLSLSATWVTHHRFPRCECPSCNAAA